MANSELTNELRRWRRRLRSSDECTRWEAAEDPPDAPAERIVPYLVEALDDPNELVRLCAAESLAWFPLPQARQAIRKFVANEKDCLAKAYGLSTLGCIAEFRDIAILSKYIKHNQPDFVRIHALLGLFCAARGFAKYALFELLHAEHPGSRSSAARGLLDLCVHGDDDEIVGAISKRLKAEKVVGGDLKGVLKELKSSSARSDPDAKQMRPSPKHSAANARRSKRPRR